MLPPNNRRIFLRKGAVGAAGLWAANADVQSAESADSPSVREDNAAAEGSQPAPQLRGSGLAPVPVESPDIGKIPWEMVDGRKEFHIYCEPVQREVLPGKWMNFFGYNGTMPGPVIEATQGDRVRFVVHNRLPEKTTVHWHGLELPVEEDGVPGMTQDAIPPGETSIYEYDLHQAGTFF